MWIDRSISEKIKNATRTRPAVLVTGMRQSGKSSLLQKLFPDALYVTLDDLMLSREANENPTLFLKRFENTETAIIDEIQYAPGLLREFKILIDNNRYLKGKWILTGSQRFSLMNHVSESLAGRISIIELSTLSCEELRYSNIGFKTDDFVKRGGFPELWAYNEIDYTEYYRDYIKTYIERDVRNILNIGDLNTFQRFLQLLALRSANLMNYTELAKDASISPNTVKSWISILESSGVIITIPPFFENLGKRVIKSPKLFFSDTGLLSYLLGIKNETDIWSLPFIGHLWENFTISEILKTVDERTGEGIFYYRDSNGVEIDLILIRNNIVNALEVKSSEQPNEKKLNFNKVLPLFEKKGYKTNAIVAAPITKGKISLNEFTLVNPAMEKVF